MKIPCWYCATVNVIKNGDRNDWFFECVKCKKVNYSDDAMEHEYYFTRQEDYKKTLKELWEE